jgi:hypothetical protein
MNIVLYLIERLREKRYQIVNIPKLINIVVIKVSKLEKLKDKIQNNQKKYIVVI